MLPQNVERRYVVRFLLVLAVLSVGLLLLIALRSNTLTGSTLDASDSPQSVCHQLRRALRGNTTTADEWRSRLLPQVYQKEGLLPSNSRLVFSIFMPSSGYGLCNVRSFILDGLILAALVGADVVLQTAETLDRPGSDPIAHQLEGYYDVEHLRAEWKRFCPSMVLYHDRRSEGSSGPLLEELEQQRGALVVRHSTYVEVGSTRTDQDAVVNNVEKRLSEMDAGIRGLLTATERPHAKRKKHAPTAYFVMNVRKLFLWDWLLPGEDASLGELHRTIGASLRTPAFITRVAARVVDYLAALGQESGNGPRFCSAHLRSEPDMVQLAGNFANGTALTDRFIEAAVAAGTKQCGLLYVAAGTQVDLERFFALAPVHGIRVVTLGLLNKTTTLLTETARWSYSQMAALEYEILAASHKFFGASASSFSWNLAIRRYFAHSTDILPLRDIMQPWEQIPYDDAHSQLFTGMHPDSSPRDRKKSEGVKGS
ncbi:membrane-associated protein, putative [Bodo saltans]|uniref:Membrane-associated protein, putative n=1 Tax=Bodo saltans TaxID=75058 RepID=A0A0S4KM20_BODSA|nr:membrane-associated protein, putative [Bodo saltans]|eukprot:CUI15547.1 membrane-associated protein, putative [Bodo saltans]